MQRIFLCIFVYSVFLFSATSASAQVYFAGWTTSPDNIPDSYHERDDNVPYHYDNFTQGKFVKTEVKSQATANDVYGEKMIVVDPHKHRWYAYAANGKLMRSGLATAGSSWCKDIDRACKTSVGTFRIQSLGSSDCVSNTYPVGEGGAPMPYCMYFNGGQGIHGSNQVVADNVSHGCVRVRVSDAEWLRYNFVSVGTKVVIKPY